MVLLQTVSGYFDTTAEAQQGVQLLLAEGFTHENVAVSTLTPPDPAVGGLPADAAGSGRFFFSLFDSNDGARPAGAEMASNYRRGMLVTVLTQSAGEARHVTERLNAAGATDITVGATD